MNLSLVAKKSGDFSRQDLSDIDFYQSNSGGWFSYLGKKYYCKESLIDYLKNSCEEKVTKEDRGNVLDNNAIKADILDVLDQYRGVSRGIEDFVIMLKAAEIKFEETKYFIITKYYDEIIDVESFNPWVIYFFQKLSNYHCDAVEDLDNYIYTEDGIVVRDIRMIRWVGGSRPLGLTNTYKSHGFPSMYIYKKYPEKDIWLFKSMNDVVVAKIIFVSIANKDTDDALELGNLEGHGYVYNEREFNIDARIDVDKRGMVGNGWMNIRMDNEDIQYSCINNTFIGVSIGVPTRYMGFLEVDYSCIHICEVGSEDINYIGDGISRENSRITHEDGWTNSELQRYKGWADNEVAIKFNTMNRVWQKEKSLGIFEFSNFYGFIIYNEKFLYINISAYMQIYGSYTIGSLVKWLEYYFGDLSYFGRFGGIEKFIVNKKLGFSKKEYREGRK